MVAPLGSIQPIFTLPPIDEIPDEDEDRPIFGEPLSILGPLELPELIYGAGNLSNQYNSDDHLAGTTPLRTIRLCLRYGIKAFDTSAYYGPSEIVLGTALKTIEVEFPRSSYKLMTKCGRYGPIEEDFDYSPSTVRKSVERSLSRLNTNYLDTVYLHDVDYVCADIMPKKEGNHVRAVTDEKELYGLAEGQEGTIWGEGDQKILEAFGELRKMKDEGLIKSIGITGYNLPTLLRLSLLILHSGPDYTAPDVVLSFSHLSIQNDTFRTFLPYFTNRAKVAQVITASPLSMGLLTSKPPAWHPAPEALKTACYEAGKACAEWEDGGGGQGMPNIALGYAYRVARELGTATVAGFSMPREVHETIRIWRQVLSGNNAQQRQEYEKQVIKALEESAAKDYSWKCT